MQIEPHWTYSLNILSFFSRAWGIMVCWGAFVDNMSLSFPTLSYWNAILLYLVVSNLFHTSQVLRWVVKK